MDMQVHYCLALCLLGGFLLQYCSAKCSKQDKRFLNFEDNDFLLHINMLNDRSPLKGSGTVYRHNGEDKDEEIQFVITGQRNLVHFDIKKLCFMVKGAKKIYVLYEGFIPWKMLQQFAVGPPKSIEEPITVRTDDLDKYIQVCFKKRGPKSKIIILMKQGDEIQVTVKDMFMRSCKVKFLNKI